MIWGYNSYRQYLEKRFPGQVIRKLCLNAGFTCPNIDGRVAKGGCTYCNNDGFVPSLADHSDILDQWDRGRLFLRRRFRKVHGFIAYFQAFSNTYAPVENLRRLYEGVHLKLPECVGLSISTRPDCVAEDVLQLLEELAKDTFLTLELGIQTDNDAILKKINRAHSAEVGVDAVHRAAGRGFDICGHFILGLKGESEDTPSRLGRMAASLPLNSVKIHNLHIMKDTMMHRQYLKGQIDVINKNEYLDAVKAFIHELRPDQVVQRSLADAPDRLLASGKWCQNKQAFLKDLKRCLPTEEKRTKAFMNEQSLCSVY